MRLLLLFSAAFGGALSGALMPGPVLFATLHRSAAHGRWAGPLIVAGHAVVEVPLMVAVILGLAGVLEAPVFGAFVGLGGGSALVAMGLMMLRSAPGLALPLEAAGNAAHSQLPALSIIVTGAFTSVSNPYFALWWATYGLNFILKARPLGVLGYAVFYTGHVLADLVWYAGVSESMHRGRRFLSDRTYRALIRSCAVVLVGLGVWFAIAGWKCLATM